MQILCNLYVFNFSSLWDFLKIETLKGFKQTSFFGKSQSFFEIMFYHLINRIFYTVLVYVLCD